MRPINERIAIRPHPREDKTAGGLVLPDIAQRKTGRGTVLAVGAGYLLPDGKTRVPLPIQVGDVVVYGIVRGLDQDVEEVYHNATEFEYEGEPCQVLSARDVLAVESPLLDMLDKPLSPSEQKLLDAGLAAGEALLKASAAQPSLVEALRGKVPTHGEAGAGAGRDAGPAGPARGRAP